MEYTTLALPLSGLLAGTLLGYIARRNFFCTLSSLESHWYGNNSSGLRTWVLAAVSAAIFTQALVALGLADTTRAVYLTANFDWLAAIIGGLAFGFGMALVGTCGFGALVRLGGGSLKSLMAILVLGISALSAQRGLLGLTRTEFLQYFTIDFGFAGDQSIPAITTAMTGLDMRFPVMVILLGTPLVWIFRDTAYRQNTASIMTGTAIGAICAFGWFVTSAISAISFDPVQIESASFVTPVGDSILQFVAFTGTGPDYGVGMIIGVVLGSAIASNSADNVRWEACDDARELSRHIVGAALMGFGGILALGCTIGQGVSAFSLLAVSVPVTMFSIGFGAKLGLAWLLEGSFASAFSR
jgi:uncharacterized membrane protein YedE/YeeE